MPREHRPSQRTAGDVPGYRLVARAGIGLFLLSLAVLWWSTGQSLAHAGPTSVCLGLPALGLGALAADFVSGLFHFLADRFGHERIFFLGRWVISTFRRHHERPLEITERDFFATNAESAIITLPFLGPSALLLLTGEPDGSVVATTVSLFLSTFFPFVFATTQFHKWAHAPEQAPSWARWLQRRRLILPPEHHALHHQAPHDRCYCITTGWWNPFLDHTAFYALVDQLGKAALPRSWVEASSRSEDRAGADHTSAAGNAP